MGKFENFGLNNLSVDELDKLIDKSISRANLFRGESSKYGSTSEKNRRLMLKRFISHPKSFSAIIRISDVVLRIMDRRSFLRLLREEIGKIEKGSVAAFDFFGLKILSFISFFSEGLTRRLLLFKVKSYSSGLIFPFERGKLSKHIKVREKDAITLNVNVLGELVLNESEADIRFKMISEMLLRSEVKYVSLKISSIKSNIMAVNHEDEVSDLVTRLVPLFKVAKSNNVFINLDMEEYKDFALTLDVFKRVLLSEGLEDYFGGVVLQAYLPDIHNAIEELLEFSKDRYEKFGSKIKIRLVKGANLAAERVDSELNGFRLATYSSKVEVDASYYLALSRLISSDNVSFDLGVASHNLFSIAFAYELAFKFEFMDRISFELLEGMANSFARYLAGESLRVILYTPVAKSSDLLSATSYLVRRFDENTSSDNFLCSMVSGLDENFEKEALRFKDAMNTINSLSLESFRSSGFKEDFLENFSLSNLDGFKNISNLDSSIIEVSNLVKSAFNKISLIKNITLALFIGGEVKGYESRVGLDKNSLEPFYTYWLANREQIDEAYKIAQRGHFDAKNTSLEERAELLFKVARELNNDRFTTLSILARDSGKTFSEGDFEISEAVDFANYYASLLIDGNHSNERFSESEGLGVVAVFSPWNFPFSISVGMILGAIASGNSVIFKPSPKTVLTGYHLVSKLYKAGVSKEQLIFLNIDEESDGQYLINNFGLDKLAMTGSYMSAVKFLSFNRRLEIFGETSGKNAMVISESADLEMAISGLVNSAFKSSGQKCSAISFLLVHESLYDENFKERLVNTINSYKVGSALDLSTTIGPVIDYKSEKFLSSYELEEGENFLIEPKFLDNYFRPVVKENVARGTRGHKVEFFGPTLSVLSYSDIRDAVEIINEIDYGLTSSYYGYDTSEINYFMDHVEVGNIYINRQSTGAVVLRHPFGGLKRSSVGFGFKSGYENYLFSYLRFNPISRIDDFESELVESLRKFSLVRRTTSLNSELNFHRYLNKRRIMVRVDLSISQVEIEALNILSKYFKFMITSPEPIDGISNLVILSLEEVYLNIDSFSHLRVLSREEIFSEKLLKIGVEVDFRALSQRADIEALSFLEEQSIAVLNHRYGNVNLGTPILPSKLVRFAGLVE